MSDSFKNIANMLGFGDDSITEINIMMDVIDSISIFRLTKKGLINAKGDVPVATMQGETLNILLGIIIMRMKWNESNKQYNPMWNNKVG